MEVTSTNAVIRPVHDSLAEPWNVSLQRLSKCSSELAAGTPWFGHGKCRKRRKITKKIEPSIGDNQQMTQQTQEVDAVVSSKGRRIQPPARYRQIAVPQGPEGGSCKIG